MPAALSKPAKQMLVLHHLLPAWKASGAPGTFDDWRHDFLVLKVGKAGLRCCSTDDLQPIIAHCWDARGRSDLALKLLLQDPRANERRQVEWKITHLLEEHGLKIGYAASICAAQFKCSLIDASTDQLWKLWFTLRKRMETRAKVAHPKP